MTSNKKFRRRSEESIRAEAKLHLLRACDELYRDSYAGAAAAALRAAEEFSRLARIEAARDVIQHD